MTQTVKIKDILPDENQPRRYFNAKTMATLRHSIEKEGIMSPLILEEMGNGKFLIIDGERRFRTAVELGLKEVPAVIEKPQTETERAIRRFSIQEQHEAWTPIEKAMAINSLAASLNVSPTEVCKSIGVLPSDTTKYVAFAQLVNKEAYVRNEIPLDFAQPIQGVKSLAKRLSEKELQEPFTRTDESAIEKKLIGLIRAGTIKQKSEVVKLKDAFAKDPKAIKKFISNDKSTPDSLFIETKAAGAYHLRNAILSLHYAETHLARFIEKKDVKLLPTQLQALKRIEKLVREVINVAE